jgi:hypothetical protein
MGRVTPPRSWVKMLKDDTRAIFTSASHAQHVVDFLYDLEVTPPLKPTPLDRAIKRKLKPPGTSHEAMNQVPVHPWSGIMVLRAAVQTACRLSAEDLPVAALQVGPRRTPRMSIRSPRAAWFDQLHSRHGLPLLSGRFQMRDSRG